MSSVFRLRGEISDMNPNEGRVEVFYRGQYGLVADDFWNKPDADVACKQLGFVKFVLCIAFDFTRKCLYLLTMKTLKNGNSISS